jgi:hypothetical protein
MKQLHHWYFFFFGGTGLHAYKAGALLLELASCFIDEIPDPQKMK